MHTRRAGHVVPRRLNCGVIRRSIVIVTLSLHRTALRAREDMSCILRVSGKELVPSALLRGTPLTIDRQWNRGEPRRTSGPGAAKLQEYGGFTIVLSEEDGDRVPAQIDDALAYLSTNAVYLEPILSHQSVESRYIDFAWWFPVGVDGPAAQCCRFPVELLALCTKLRLGLEVSVYATADEEQEEARGVRGAV